MNVYRLDIKPHVFAEYDPAGANVVGVLAREHQNAPFLDSRSPSGLPIATWAASANAIAVLPDPVLAVSE